MSPRGGAVDGKDFHVPEDEKIDLKNGRPELSRGDVEERKHWKEYMKAYAACLSATSTREPPWHVG